MISLWVIYIPPKLLLSSCFAPAPWDLVLWGMQKVQQKGDLHIIFACSGPMLLCPEFFLVGFPWVVDGYWSRDGGMQSCVTFLQNTGAFNSAC